MHSLSQPKNFTSGKLFPAVIRFAIPLFISSLVQSLFTAADTAVVGNFTAGDDTAVASIGAANPVIFLLVNSFISFATGAGIIIARAIGANDKAQLKKAVDTSVIFSAILGISLALASFFLSVPVLKAMDCPDSCFDSAVMYLKIYMMGTPVAMIYNFGAAIIRSEGDSTRPLYYIIISGIVNILCNILLCIVLDDKVIAVAVATVLSQTVSAVLVMVRLITKKDGYCHFSFKDISYDWKSTGAILRYGIPLSISSAIYPIAGLQIQPAINSYGSANLAGGAAASNIDSISNTLYVAFNSASLTFMSQNIGAHNRKRVMQTFWLCGICAFLSGLVIGLVSFRYSEQLLSLFLPGNPEAIYYGQKRMQYVSAYLWVAALNGSLSAAISAFGYPTMSTLNNLISVLGFRIIWMNFVYNRAPTIDLLYVCYTISWSLTCVIYIILFIYALIKYQRKEKLREAQQTQPDPA